MPRPIWITVVEDGVVSFEGHQGHWADVYFSNATRGAIEYYLNDPTCTDAEHRTYTIREMTDEDMVQYPEAVRFVNYLIEQYCEA